MSTPGDARRIALRCLGRLDREPHRTAQAVVREILDGPDIRGLDERDRGLATELTYGALRWRLRLDAMLGRLVARPPDDPEVQNVLRLGVLQLLVLDRIPSHAAVHATVELARRVRGERIAGFVNGVLRSLERDRAALLQAETVGERMAHPEWLVTRLREWVGEEALQSVLEANVAVPPVSLRLHPSTPRDLLPDAQDSEVPGVVFVDSEAAVVRQGVRDGRWIHQDPSSAAAVRHLAVPKGARVLELCAGRGVKTSQLAEQAGLLVAMDLSANKLAAAQRLVQRWARAEPVFVAADATRPLPLAPELRFDRILLDAPCTGLGVIRRRPETLWRRQPEDIAVLAGMQHAMLAEALRWLAPGGELVYSVCTISPEETRDVTRAYQPVEELLTLPGGPAGGDGFYVARLRA